MKTYKVQQSIGMARHVVSYTTGDKRHRDGSPFSDMRLFSNKRERDKFIAELKSLGYVER